MTEKTSEKKEPKEVTQPAVLTTDELLGSLPDEPLTRNVTGPFGGTVVIRAIEDNSELCQMISKMALRAKNRVPGTTDMPDATIEQITWVEYGVVEPKLTWDDAVKLSKKCGWWVFKTYREIQKLTGVREEDIAEVVEQMQNPFDSSTSKPV